MNEEVWFLFGSGLGAAMVLMVVAWLLARRMNNAAVLDVAWPLGFLVIVAICLALGSGAFERKALIAGMVTVWSVRLAIHQWVRLIWRHPAEDSRYAALRGRFSRQSGVMFLGLFELQAVFVAVLSMPFILVSVNPAAGIGPFEGYGFGIWLVALIGETAADRQLSRFRTNPENAGRICNTGLWRYSRHPNYFFEWLVWVGYFVFALGSPHGWLTIYCPIAVLFSLLRVSGIPPTEEQAVKSRGDAYREYQRTTSPFVPWFPAASGKQRTRQAPESL